jgi:non-specific serine/threonine protein kinase
MIGTLLQNRYRLDAEIGQGGMGTVYRAHDTLLARAVAINILNDTGLGTEGRARLLREAQAAAKLNHPNIVAVHDAGEVDPSAGSGRTTPFIVMELVEGPSLRECPPTTLAETLQVAQQLCAALEHAHAHGIVHRDLKPENVLVVRASSPQPPSPELQSNSGEGGARWVSRVAAPPLLKHAVSFQEWGLGGEARVKLMDFGLARTFDSHLTTEGMIVGTLSYLAPEQALGQAVDGRADLYALGVMLYELTTGRLPFTADDPIAVISQHLYAPIVSPRTLNEAIPPELDALIVRLLSKQPDQRLASAREVSSALERISVGERVSYILTEGPRHNLPAQASRFIGRERELVEVNQLLSNPACRLLTLVGAGGMGKTRLALEVAHKSLEKFPAGVWLTELAPIDRDESVAPAVAGAIGVQAQPPHSLIDTIIDALQTRVLLLVIDNCEHVLDGAAQLAAKILERCPDTKILTTSREPLHLAGEHLYTVPGLLLPEKDSAAEQLSEVDAVRLFVERASAVRTGFALDAHNTSDVITICRSLDGMPLAIELAAARVRALSPHEIAQRVGQQLRLLSGSQRADVPHHQTLQATIAWSYDLLSEAERTVFNRLSVFHGGCRLEAAEHICSGDGIEPDEVLDLLTSLVDKSMVVAETGVEGATRYRLLETLRQYGHERLIELGQEDAICQRHAEYYTELVEQLDAWLRGPQWPGVPERWQVEEDNIFAAMSWSANHSDGVLALRIGGAGRDCKDNWSHRRWKEYGDYMRQSLLKGSEIPANYKVKALISIGRSCEEGGELEHALRYCEESLALARQLDNRLLLGQALFWLAEVELELGHLDQMRVHATECVEIGHEINDTILVWPSVWLGLVEPPDRRLALLEEFVDVAEKNRAICLSRAYQFLGEYHLDDGDLQRANQLFEESEHADDQVTSDKDSLEDLQAMTSSGLGRIALMRGDFAKATSLFEKGRNRWRALGWEHESASLTRMLGKVAWYQSDYEAATRYYQECFDILQRFSDRDEMVVTQIHQVMLLRDQGEYQRAKQLCDESLEVVRQVNWRDEIGWALSAQASIVHSMGESEQAVKIYREGLTVLSESSDRILKVEVIEGLGVALASAKDYLRAARLLAFAEAWRKERGIVLPPPEQPYRDEALKILREALNEETFAQAWQAGAALTLEEALAEASGNAQGQH